MRRLPNNELHRMLVYYLRKNLGAPVYDYVPENVKLPFITIGAVNIQDKGLKVEDITHASVQIHIWSDYKGRREINLLAEKIINLFSTVQLDLTADQFYVNSQGIDFYETYPEGDGGYNGILTLEADIQNLKGE